MSKIILFFINGYQKIFSPDNGFFVKAGIMKKRSVCVFYPTCSEYAKIAFEKHGFTRGLAESTWRILRCHPWQKQHTDPI